jgi:hypothetical protein
MEHTGLLTYACGSNMFTAGAPSVGPLLVSLQYCGRQLHLHAQPLAACLSEGRLGRLPACPKFGMYYTLAVMECLCCADASFLQQSVRCLLTALSILLEALADWGLLADPMTRVPCYALYSGATQTLAAALRRVFGFAMWLAQCVLDST